MDCEGYMAALAHKALKMARKLGRGVGPPDPVAPDASHAISGQHAADDALSESFALLWYFDWASL